MAALTDVDLVDPAFWRRPYAERLAGFARLRALGSPVYYANRPGGVFGSGAGFHALVRHADVVQASRTPEVFISGPGVTTPRPPRWVRLIFGDSMVNLDDPRHAALRGIVSKAFTPRVIARTTGDIGRVVTALVDAVGRHPTGDFVEAVAGPLPYLVICDMMGIPARLRDGILGQINRATEGSGARRRLRVPGRGLRGLATLHRVVGRVGRERRREPSDDLISALVTANVDGTRLTARQLGAFFSLLLVAGVETSRNAVAHGLSLLTAHPEQRELLVSDFDRWGTGFVDEVVRYSSPIIQFRRTVARDHVLGGHPLRAGEDVVLFYTSANRDEAVFTRPDSFDLTRAPNPHVGFGGGGPHYCLGAFLARQEMTLLFRELLTRFPEIHATGEPELVPSAFDNRVGRLAYAAYRR
jgi:cytochrome P450